MEQSPAASTTTDERVESPVARILPFPSRAKLDDSQPPPDDGEFVIIWTHARILEHVERYRLQLEAAQAVARRLLTGYVSWSSVATATAEIQPLLDDWASMHAHLVSYETRLRNLK